MGCPGCPGVAWELADPTLRLIPLSSPARRAVPADLGAQHQRQNARLCTGRQAVTGRLQNHRAGSAERKTRSLSSTIPTGTEGERHWGGWARGACQEELRDLAGPGRPGIAEELADPDQRLITFDRTARRAVPADLGPWALTSKSKTKQGPLPIGIKKGPFAAGPDESPKEQADHAAIWC